MPSRPITSTYLMRPLRSLEQAALELADSERLPWDVPRGRDLLLQDEQRKPTMPRAVPEAA